MKITFVVSEERFKKCENKLESNGTELYRDCGNKEFYNVESSIEVSKSDGGFTVSEISIFCAKCGYLIE